MRPMDFLLRLLYVIEKSGEWAGWEPIVRMAERRRRVGRLPIEVGSADVEGVGSRAVFDGRCEALRQLSLIGWHIGMTLERDDNGEERLNGHLLTIRSLQTLPANSPFHNIFDPNNPVCADYASIRDAVLHRVRSGTSVVADQTVHQHNNAPRYNRLRELTTQQPPVWNCHTVSTIHRPPELFGRVIVLHGDQPDHQFEATIIISSCPDVATAHLWTTEPPVAGKEGAAKFPQ
ncbi:unnamed protein product [Vitrella brassicaformis CCMP3155]|uniref:Uncharacterized protein n=1 Tax=Vitrella brassicaformis (strain CCMP3155) TaxID=1169540 RepID=A0A0G4ETS1_VITBC|nr:unnamed protein product [Vitrella brassicaformis CCMP3155]|eukprot:CEM01654.1 unnamed protein product [Vitrella brassicaformis CCMP3155]